MSDAPRADSHDAIRAGGGRSTIGIAYGLGSGSVDLHRIHELS